MQYQFADRLNGIEGSAIRQIFSLLGDPEMISFAGGNPSPATFPKDALAAIAGALIQEEGASVLQYGGTVGEPSFLKAVAQLLSKEGMHPQEGELIALTGSSQGIELMAKTFVNAGDVVLCESPTFLGALQTFRTYEANVIGVAMDEQGILLSDLEEKLATHHPKFLYTIPTFQNPTGRSLPEDRRKALVPLCRKYGCLILEDDPYGQLRYEGSPLPGIRCFDEEGDLVVRLISFSKTISPGLRIGAAYGPREIIHKFNLNKQGMDVHTANLNQRMVACYIESGGYQKGVQFNCDAYRDKAALMADLAQECFPKGSQIVRPEGGMFLWVELPKEYNATALFKKAVENKVAYVPGTHFYPDGGHHNTLRLNFTMVDPVAIRKGMQRLKEIFL